VLSQVQNNKEKIISFYSALHNAAEKNYSTTEQELLAIVSAIRHFRHYLTESEFLLRTDHKAQIYLTKSKDNNSRLFRWALALQEYQFEIEHLKGDENFSDILSRAFCCNSLKGNDDRTLPLPEDQHKIIHQYHIKTGHGGEDTLKYHIMRKYCWKNANKMINEFVKNCETCQKNKRNFKERVINPMRIYVPGFRWKIDLIGSMDQGGYVFSCVDVFTRFAWTRILIDKNAFRVVMALEDIFKEGYVPKEILCDNGCEFVNKILENLCSEKCIKLLHGSPYTPTTTGAVERFHQTLLSKLKKLTNNGELSWKRTLEEATNSYNHSRTRTHGFTPYELRGECCHVK